jgi:hypothetical protein
MDIAHPDVDGVMERLFEEVKVQDAAEEFFVKKGDQNTRTRSVHVSTRRRR